MDSYEKKYKEALEVAKRRLCFDKAGMVDSFTTNDIYGMFPELAKSEDERIREELIGFLRNIPNSNYTCEEMALWLEKQAAQKSTWSEEDENIKEWIMSDINKLLALNRKSFVIADKEIIWLKSLKDRVGCEVNYTTTKEWKPSEEQMKELNYAVFVMASSKFVRENDYCYNVLKSLRDQLKKLK